jgi:hypothetical protein
MLSVNTENERPPENLCPATTEYMAQLEKISGRQLSTAFRLKEHFRGSAPHPIPMSTKQQMSTNNNAAISEGENVPEIQTLSQRVLALNQATDWWNTAMIWALVFTALSAIAVVGTTVMALKRAKQVGDAQAELIHAKDAKLTLDLGDKDLKIAQAGKDASEANRGAAEANERALKAQQSLASAEQHAAEANVKAEGFRLDIANANERAAEANRVAEQERLARIKIEERLSPRRLSQEQYNRLVAVLKAYPGVPYELMITPTPESASFIAQIDNVLGAAGWTFSKSAKTDFRFVSTVNGKEAEQGVFAGIIIGTPPAIAAKFKPAADALVLWLYNEGFSAKGGLLPDDDPSPNNIHVMIGTKE